jgi:hypothetical protein
MNALDTPERRNQFSATWGLGFETYCLDGLGKVFSTKKWTFIRNAIDSSTNEELSDAVAARDDIVVLVECKGTFITSAEKYSGVPGRFMRGLTRKFGRGKHGGVYQLVRAISHVWFQCVATETVPRSQHTADVFPVLLVQDPIVGCGPVAKVLSDRFQKAIDDARRNVNHKTPKIWPLLVLTGDDLDRMVAASKIPGAQTPIALMKRFHRTHPSRIISFGDFLTSPFGSEFCPSSKLKPIVNERFTTVTRGTLERFRQGEYGGNVGEQPQS